MEHEEQVAEQEKKMPVWGIHIACRLPSGGIEYLAYDVQKTVFSYGCGLIQKGNKGRYLIDMFANLPGYRKEPLIIQTPPLVVHTFKEIVKPKYSSAIVALDYHSVTKEAAAVQFLQDMEFLDAKNRSFLLASRRWIWPDEDLTDNQVVERYRGFSSERIWRKPVEDKKEERKKEIQYPDLLAPAELVKKGDSFEIKEPASKKQCNADRETDVVGGEEEETTFSFPASFTFFPLIRKKKYECLCLDSKKNVLKMSTALKEGYECVAVCSLNLQLDKEKIVSVNATGMTITVSEVAVKDRYTPATKKYIPL